MGTLIECSELCILRNIPAELTDLKKQNTALIRSNKTYKAVMITMIASIGLGLMIKIIKTVRHEKRAALKGQDGDRK